ncbi:putative ribonuclease H-like domain-containing protein [Tanacetum coccineum]
MLIQTQKNIDEQSIIIPSYPSHSIQVAEPKDISSNEVDDSPLDSAEEIFQKEIARLKSQEQRATFNPNSSVIKRISPGSVPVPTGSPTDSFFDDEPTTRFPSPSDLGNNEPLLGIISSSSYDDEFGADLNNLASIVEVSPVATKRINTIHPQSLIIGDHTLAVQTRSKYDIGTKWILKNKRDARGIVVRNKARLVAQGHIQEEGIDYDEVFAPVVRIKAIRLFLAFASYLGFMVYQMDVKSAFLYGRIDEEVYVTQSKGFGGPQHPKKVLQVVKALIWTSSSTKSLNWKMSDMGELTFFLGLQVQQRPDGMFISQDKYVQEILKKFDLESVRTATTPYEAPKPKSKNEPDSPFSAIESPFVLEAYSDSEYAGANKDRKSTTGGCQFLGRRLISWQCKKQTIVATSSTKAEYVAVANCCGQITVQRVD